MPLWIVAHARVVRRRPPREWVRLFVCPSKPSQAPFELSFIICTHWGGPFWAVSLSLSLLSFGLLLVSIYSCFNCNSLLFLKPCAGYSNLSESKAPISPKILRLQSVPTVFWRVCYLSEWQARDISKKWLTYLRLQTLLFFLALSNS